MVRQSSLTELESPFALSAEDRDRLSRRLETAVKRARRSGGETLATISLALPAGVDPSAVVLGSRGAGEPWMCFEQPDRERTVVATLGAVVALVAALAMPAVAQTPTAEDHPAIPPSPPAVQAEGPANQCSSTPTW